MAQKLGQVAVGSIVKLKENGAAVNYIVVHQGKPSSSYDSSCDGTWLLRQDIAENRVWDSGNSSVLESSDIHSYLNNTWINRYDTDIRNAIKQVKIPYRKNGGEGGTDRNGANGLSCKIFLLSGKEVGWDSSDSQYFPNDGAKLAYFLDGTGSSANQKRVATLNGSATNWWLRSPFTDFTNFVWIVLSNGESSNLRANFSYGVRPCFVLPTTLYVSDDGTIIIPLDPPSALNTPSLAMQGKPVSVSWSEVDGADGYILERNADNGGWTQVYSGANTSYEDTAGTWTTVQHRVKAGTYGDYTTSAVISVVSALALVISGSDGDLGTLLNDVSYVVASDGTNALNVTEVINGVTTRSYTAVNGGNNVIPVVDLPTGYGTISITASTNPGSGVVSVERNWTYSKEAITFPDAGGVADLTQQGQTIWAKTIAEAVRAPGIWGGNLGLALQTLAKAVLYDPETGGFEGIGGADATIPVPRIETGSYVGTGTYGQSNPNTLTFGFEPFLLMISALSNQNTDGPFIAMNPGQGICITRGSEGLAVMTWQGETVSWYNTRNDAYQMNDADRTYNYVAIGLAGGAA